MCRSIFDELVAIDTPENGQQFFLGFANVINAARKCPKFIIGRVQGKTVGGGVGMASATDYCFATKFDPIVSKQYFSNAAELKGEIYFFGILKNNSREQYSFSKHLEVDDERENFIFDTCTARTSPRIFFK